MGDRRPLFLSLAATALAVAAIVVAVLAATSLDDQGATSAAAAGPGGRHAVTDITVISAHASQSQRQAVANAQARTPLHPHSNVIRNRYCSYDYDFTGCRIWLNRNETDRFWRSWRYASRVLIDDLGLNIAAVSSVTLLGPAQTAARTFWSLGQCLGADNVAAGFAVSVWGWKGTGC